MIQKYIGVLVIPLLLAGCGRQSRGTASAAGAAGASTTMPANTQAASPQPANAALPPIQGTVPNETSPEPPAGAQISNSVTIPAQTRIRVRLADSLDTRRVRPGYRFTAYLDDPIVSGDRVVLPKGTVFEGRVTEARNSGRLRGRAYLGVTLDAFQYDGASYSIATYADVRESASHKRRNLAFIGGSSGSGAAIGAIAGGGVGALIGAGAGAAAGTGGAFITGKKSVRLPAESVLVFSLHSAVTVRS